MSVVCMADASAVHVYSLTSNLNDQRKDGAFCDILLKISGQMLPTHSCVLSACSPFFRNLIREHRASAPYLTDYPQEIELDLPEDSTADADNDTQTESTEDLAALTDLLDYMYTGKIELKEETLHVVVQLAQAFMLDDLTTLIGTYVNGPGKDIFQDETAKRKRSTSLEVRRRRCKKKLRRKKAGQVLVTESATSAVSETLDALRILRQEEPEGNDSSTVADNADASYEIESSEDESEEEPMECGVEEVGSKEGLAFRYFRPLVKKRKDKKLSDEQFECRHCDFVSMELKAIREHKLLHPGRSYKCSGTACDYHTGLASKMLAHMAEAEHPQAECSLCGFALGEDADGGDDREPLQRHLERHASDTRNPFFCLLCDFRCRTRGNLAMHAASKHSAERPFVCHFCGKAFKWAASLQIHLQIHSGKCFLCDQCGFTTAYKHHLTMHKRIHNGGMFTCQVQGCDFQSICKQKLERHLTTAHDGGMQRTPRAPRGSRAASVVAATQIQPAAHEQVQLLLPPPYVATYY